MSCLTNDEGAVNMISIIIPAYNCSETLAAAVESAAAQDFDSIEIIIIDDGSSDSTHAVISSLQDKYSFIKSVRTENGGPAKARNCGIRESTGDYIMFLDSDDTFSDGIFKKIEPLLKNTPDMLIFGFRQNFYGRSEDKIYSPDTEFEIDTFYKNNLLNQVWNKVYLADFIKENDITFKDYKYGEDRLFNADVLDLSPTVETLPDILYNYNIDKSVSLISGYIPEKFTACKEINRRFSSLCENKTVANYMFIKNIVSCMTVLFAENCNLTRKEKKYEVKRILSDDVVRATVKNKQSAVTAKIIRLIIKTNCVSLNYLFAETVAVCQKKLLPLFLKFRG